MFLGIFEQNFGPIIRSKNNTKHASFGPQNWDQKFRGTLAQASSGTLLAQDGPKMALRWLKMPKMRPRWPQDGPR